MSILNPHPEAFQTFGDINKAEKYRRNEIPAKDKPEDHPMILEIRRRLIGATEELHECGFM